MPFKLAAPFSPTGDQPQAIDALVAGLDARIRFQALLGVTGSGKTFTMANVIAKTQRPTLILSHNKTLAAQLYEELKRFFPDNAVHYFVSYYDYYQPEAYIPQTDTYIDKDVKINDELDRLRHAATQAVLSRNDVIVVASVSAIYNIGSPEHYAALSLALAQGQRLTRRELLARLTDLQYARNDVEQLPGTFRVRGGAISIAAPTGESVVAVEIERNRVVSLAKSGTGLDDPTTPVAAAHLFPAKFWAPQPNTIPLALTNIKAELAQRLRELKKRNRLLEAQRLEQRTREDLAMIRETGYCHGIENYSRHMEFRDPDSPPYTLVDYFNKAYGGARTIADPTQTHADTDPRRSAFSQRRSADGWITIIDESHQTIPQLRGMVRGDRARKDVLIEYGFRLPSARDNRPLDFKEFLAKTGQIIFASATPGPYEQRVSRRVVKPETLNSKPETSPKSPPSLKLRRASKTQKGVPGFVEQLVRPTGLLDPTIEVRPTRGQLDCLVSEIQKRVEKNQRVLVTTLTKRLAEELTEWLNSQSIRPGTRTKFGAGQHRTVPRSGSVRAEYLHADIKTLERPELLHKLRAGEIDVLVGINLLREGLDLPEVSLVAIFDADQEGFLRNETTLIQTMGRAARHVEGRAILFADTVTGSMRAAIAETQRRRKIQDAWNRKYGIVPASITKAVERSTLIGRHAEDENAAHGAATPQLLKGLRREMHEAAKNLDFEKAAKIRDLIERFTQRGPRENKKEGLSGPS